MEITKEDIELLKKINDYEKTMSKYDKSIGWAWHNISVYPATIHKLVVRDLVKITFKSRSGTNYLLTDVGRGVAEAGLPEGAAVLGDEVEQAVERILDLSQLFSDITGYDDIKELLRESLQLEKAIHVLLSGPPSLAKSMFLWDIEQAYGDLAMPLLGSATSHAGLWDMVAERKPKVILVDEIEKMSLTDMSALLSIMQTGRIIRAKVGRKLDVKVNAWVIAAANRTHKMPAELLSRFAICQLAEYSASEFRNVVTNVLIAHEDTDKDTAAEIAMRLVGKTHDVRDAVRVARLAKRVGVERATVLLIR